MQKVDKRFYFIATSGPLSARIIPKVSRSEIVTLEASIYIRLCGGRVYNTVCRETFTENDCQDVEETYVKAELWLQRQLADLRVDIDVLLLESAKNSWRTKSMWE